jgi:hypothetical protein
MVLNSNLEIGFYASEITKPLQIRFGRNGFLMYVQGCANHENIGNRGNLQFPSQIKFPLPL